MLALVPDIAAASRRAGFRVLMTAAWNLESAEMEYQEPPEIGRKYPLMQSLLRIAICTWVFLRKPGVG